MEQLTFHLQSFEGPLDLLEHLIKKNKLNICSISLIAITDQYIEYIERMHKMDLELSSDFLVVASNLLYIKSKALLPKHEEEDDADQIARDLTEALLERARMKLIAEEFKKRQYDGTFRFFKGPEPFEGEHVVKTLDPVPLDKLLDAFRVVLEKTERKLPPPKTNFEGIVGHEKVSVKEKANGLINRLKTQKTVRFEHIFSDVRTKSAAVALFLAVLELLKVGRVLATDEEDGLYLKLGRARGNVDEVWEEKGGQMQSEGLHGDQ
ncbi:MAG: hypothetical protein E7409_05585 [Ruminococcaceae bacterium]|nr:hypothetical protein [Oscillospiraceae bacterium]